MFKQDVSQFQLPERKVKRLIILPVECRWRQNMVKTIDDVNSHR